MSGGSVPTGSCPLDLCDPLGHELAGAVIVGVWLELDRDLGHAELGVGSNATHVGQTCEGDFKGNGDGGLELFCSHRRVLRDDIEHGSREIGEHITRQVLEPEGPDDRASRDEQCGEERRVKGFANEPANHGAPQCSSWSPSPFSA